MSQLPPAPSTARARMFALTWLSYFSYYQVRKNVSIAKARLIEDGLASKSEFALVETLYTFAYAVGQFGWGFSADVLSPRRMLAVGMLASAGLSALFGIGDSAAVWAIAFGLNGLAQSSGWPNNSRVMASWFSANERGSVLGLWGTCYQIGPLISTGVATYLVERVGWRWALFGPAVWTALVALAIHLWLLDKPADAGYASPESDSAVTGKAGRQLRRAAWSAMVRRPAVWLLGLNYFCIKLIRYSLWFWLPTYFMELGFNSDGDYGYLSMSFELGGVVGVVATGVIADKLFGRRRIAVAAVMMALLACALLAYNLSGSTGFWPNFLWMTVVGAFLFGPDSLVSGASAQDVGGPHAAAAASGFVNGLGSIGAIVQGYLTAYVSDRWGWEPMFYIFMVLAVVGTAALLPLVRLRPNPGGQMG